MSGKLIMKRKLDKTRNVEVVAEPLMDNNRNDEESSSLQSESKRLRCDTPPPESEDLNLLQATDRNRQLLEAIQLKMLELQNELDAFEHDVEAHEDDYNYYDQDDLHLPQPSQISDHEAEALGFAMCAQETMEFLQREGIPSSSLLYTRLHDALVGRSQPDRVFHL